MIWKTRKEPKYYFKKHSMDCPPAFLYVGQVSYNETPGLVAWKAKLFSQGVVLIYLKKATYEFFMMLL